MVGDSVKKTGRTTGTTEGPVVSTCTETLPDTLFHVSIFCAHIAQMADSLGDSGAPVYYWRVPLAADWVHPEGMAFAAGRINGVIHTVFITMDQLEHDLGVTLDRHHP